jgi:hypothetical protein
MKDNSQHPDTDFMRPLTQYYYKHTESWLLSNCPRTVTIRHVGKLLAATGKSKYFEHITRTSDSLEKDLIITKNQS